MNSYFSTFLCTGVLSTMMIKKKRITAALLALGLGAVTMFSQFPVSAAEETAQNTDAAAQTADPSVVVTNDIDGWPQASDISSTAAIVMETSTNTVLYSKNADNKLYPASITKIMTAMLALQSGKLNDTVTITQDNVTLEDGSQVCGFVAGDQVTLDQLLHCLLVYSGNDAASAIAEYVGGSTENFVQMMNDYAAKLGCTGTHFSNPHGLQDENHYTTPYDIYLMLNEAFTYPEFTEITELPSYTVTYTGSDLSLIHI